MSKTLVIAEQSEIIRKGLVHLIEGMGLFSTIREMGCFANLEENLTRLNPDVLLVNPSLVNADLLSQLQQISPKELRIAAIVYSLFDDELISLFDEVVMVVDNRSKLQKKLSGLIHKAAVRKNEKAENALSSRELDVLKLLVQGMSNKEISDKLFISTHTVISHRKNITQKLNIKSVAGLTVYALLNDVITMQDVK